jgi:pimeloyl-ACP methyl ester carboxylesterase
MIVWARSTPHSSRRTEALCGSGRPTMVAQTPPCLRCLIPWIYVWPGPGRFVAVGGDMAEKWEYRVVYVDPRGRISSEGVEFVRQSGENRTAFMKRYLDTLGDEGWELAGLHPLVRTESSYVILKRPKASAA